MKHSFGASCLPRLCPHSAFLLAGILIASVSAFAAQEAGAPPVLEPQPAGELAPYAAFGSAVADQIRLADLNWNDAQLTAFVAGIRASYLKRSYRFDAAAQRLSEQVTRRIQELSAGRADTTPAPQAIEQYMREAREGLGMQQSQSGLLYLIVQAGAGPRPGSNDRIVLSFTAVAADGKTPLAQLAVQKMRTKVSDLLPGLAEGVQLIALGGRAAFVVPPQLSFATGQWPAGVDVGTPIIFRVELEDIFPEGGTP